MDPQDFKAPYLPKERIWPQADEFRRENWPTGAIPVDVLSIVEIDLGVEIRPISSLRASADTDALLLANRQTIIVDETLFMDDRYLNRLRFSVAHELGHFVLHKNISAQMQRDTVDDWAEFVCGISEREYSFFEFQANEFAGRFMVPFDALSRELEKAINVAEQDGLARSRLSDAALPYLAKMIARNFALSDSVIERRLIREGLWPLDR